LVTALALMAGVQPAYAAGEDGEALVASLGSVTGNKALNSHTSIAQGTATTSAKAHYLAVSWALKP